MRTALCLMLIVVGNTGGEISLAHAMKHAGEVQSFALKSLLGLLRRARQQPWFWVGIALLALNFFALLTLLSWANVSFVIPATALSYVVGALAAKLLLGERLTPLRWAGILLVSAGVAAVTIGR